MTGLRELVEAVREARRVALARPGRDGQADAAAATLEAYLLDTPDVLAAVEAVVALGEARARRSEALHQWNTGVPIRRLADAMVATSSAQDAAVDVVSAIADRLAARKGE